MPSVQFKQTEYGVIVDLMDKIFSNSVFGARADVPTLVFLLTDGKQNLFGRAS